MLVRTGMNTHLTHDIGFQTHIGRSHLVNQDAGGAWHHTREDGTAVTFLIVADGVSAGRHSEEASRLIVDTLRRELDDVLQDPSQDAGALLELLAAATLEANHEVARRPHVSAQTADATTLAALICIGVDVAGVWCGDSRAYRIDSDVSRLTRDHSWAEGMVSHGLMTTEQAALDPRAHMITRWLGPPDQDDPGLETFRLQIGTGDVVLCCSDGLYMYFASPYGEESEIRDILLHGSIQPGVDALIETAMRRGGHDDITAAALRIVSGA